MMQKKSDDFETWYERFKYLKQGFKERKYPDYENDYCRFIWDFDGLSGDEDAIVGEEFEITQIGIDGLDYERLRNDSDYRDELGRKGNYITLIRGEANRIVENFDKAIYYGFFIDEKKYDDTLTELLDSNFPSQLSNHKVFHTNNLTAEIIKDIIDKLLDVNYLPNDDKILEYFECCLSDFNILLKFLLDISKQQIIKYINDAEKKIYDCEILDTLNESLRYYKRKLINKSLHPDIANLIKHIELQIEHVLRKYDYENFISHLNSTNKTSMPGLQQHLSFAETVAIGVIDNEREMLHQEKLLKRYTFKKTDEVCQEIYNICSNAFDCDYATFRLGIETADFHLIKIKNKTIVQDLTYRLSGIMDKEWYKDICINMGWKKEICSGKGAKLQGNRIINKLNIKLPRPSRVNNY